FIGLVRAISLSSQVNSLKNKVADFETTLTDSANQTSTLDVSRVQYYMTNFIYAYINYDKESAEEREQTLQDYYAFDSSTYTEELNETRTLKSQRVISVEEYKSYDLAIVKVGYEVSGNSYVMNLAVPFKIKDGLLTIVSLPYSLADDLYQGDSKSFEKNDSSDLVKLSSSETDSIKEFLEVFFDKYASSDETDLKLVMKEPVLMGGSYQVDTIDNSTALFYEGDDGQKVVQVSVTFTDKNTTDKHTENFTLYLSQSDNGWVVEKLYNYFKN
ncbi:conjugal transfer protein, partial [Streptococcus gallolyticus]